jgi:hypothetical protein
MSLRKSPQRTPQMLAAARRNSRHSTGPVTPAAKRNVKLNALKHGAYVRDENQRQAMQALGEDPEKFEALREELRSAFAPGDAFFEKQIEDLAWLYWRRERLERTLSGLRRRALQGIERWQHRRRQEMADATFDASRHELINWNLASSEDRGVQLRLRLSYLGVLREEFKQGTYRPRQEVVFRSVYPAELGWRPQMIFALWYRFWTVVETAQKAAEDPHYVEFLRGMGELREPPGEAEHQELLRLLAEEMASAEEELAYEEKMNEERVAIERDACLAPQDDAWRILVRQEGSLDRSIDRKVRILLGLRKESARPASAPPGGRGDRQGEDFEGAGGSSPENAELVEVRGNTKMKEQSGNVIENKRPSTENQRGDGNVLEHRGGRPDPVGMAWKGEDGVGSEAPAGALPGAAAV